MMPRAVPTGVPVHTPAAQINWHGLIRFLHAQATYKATQALKKLTEGEIMVI